MKLSFFLDTSYFLYYTIFGAYAALKKIKEVPEGNDVDLTQDPEFIEILDKKFTDRFKFLINSIIVPIHEDFGIEYDPDSKQKIFGAFDCAKNKIWRVSKFNFYKLQRRVETAKPFNIGATFGYVFNVLLKSDFIIKRLNNPIDFIPIKCNGAEGDDIIATLVKHSQADKKIIIASDRDFVQLLVDPNVILMDLAGERITLNSIVNGKISSYKEYLLYKILFGDPADNIPHILPKYGHKKCLNLAKEPTKILKLLKENNQAAKQFKINSELIDMKKIPEDIENEILNSIKERIVD